MRGETSVTRRVFSGQNLFLLISLALGHTLMHCFQQGWYIVLPSVKETFGLSNVQYGSIESIRSASSTAVQIPSGALSHAPQSVGHHSRIRTACCRRCMGSTWTGPELRHSPSGGDSCGHRCRFVAPACTVCPVRPSRRTPRIGTLDTRYGRQFG